jgi:hypothetical protein
MRSFQNFLFCALGLTILFVSGCDFNKSLESVATPYQPIAVFLNTPPARSNITALNVSISSDKKIAFYQYKVGVQATTDCKDDFGFSNDIPVATPITDDISALPDQNIILCARAKDEDDIYQRFDSISSYVWLKDTVAPTATLSGEPASPSNTVILSMSAGGTDVVSYRYKVGAVATTDCSVAGGYSVTDISIGTPITDDISNLTAFPDGDMIVCAVGKDIAGNEQDMAAATSVTWSKDFTPPTAPTALANGVVPSSYSTTPTLSWTAATDLPMPPQTGVDHYQVQIYQASGDVLQKDWTTLTSGSSISGLHLIPELEYYFKVRAIDVVGNIGPAATSAHWTAAFSNEAWATIASSGPPPERRGFAQAWTGTKLFIWGGLDASGTALNDGGVYDYSTDTWAAADSTDGDIPSARAASSVIWTGSKVIIWGGSNNAGSYFNDGATYDPYAPAANANLWETIPTTGAPTSRAHALIAWNGVEAVIWGGDNAGAALGDGARYNPIKKVWTAMTATNAPSARTGGTAIWTGTQFIVWGGYDGSATAYSDGASYNPANDTWTTLPASPLSARYNHIAVWTGEKMLVFGGSDGSSYFNDGAAYDPGTNTWSAISSTNAPSARSTPQAVWTGTYLWVWGGADSGGALSDGAFYDPSRDTWTTVSSASLSARLGAAAFWSGDRVVVWGGRDSSGVLNDGASYVFPSACPNVPAGFTTFSFLAQSAQTFTAPATCSRVVIKAWGAGGGKGSLGGGGGGGGYTCGVFSVTPGDVLSVYVGDKGQSSSWGYGSGGPAESRPSAQLGGAGGGASAVYNQTQSSLYVVAGGGGGGGAAVVNGVYASLGQGGAGGGGNGYGGSTSTDIFDGIGGGGGLAGLFGGNGGAGTSNAGGVDGLMCTLKDGGKGSNSDAGHTLASGGGGGGGGGGYIGGGGGGSGTTDTGGGGGGGGANYINTSLSLGNSALSAWGFLSDPGALSDSQRPTSAGKGQSYNGTQPSGEGSVLIGCY